MSEHSRETLEAWDDAYVWHPFTPHSVYRSEQPLTVVAGEGHYLIDADNKRYLDGVGSIWCNLFGHRRKEIDDAIKAQLDRIAHSTFLGNSGEAGILLAKELLEWAPDGLSKVFYSDNGSTAVEIALKMALQYWSQAEGSSPEESASFRKRKRFLALTNAYNGDTIGAVSVGGIDLFHKRFQPMLFDVIRAPSPYIYRRPEGQSIEQAEQAFVEQFEQLLRQHADQLAAVVMEPGMQAAGGMITYPDGFLRKVREWTDELGVLLILDEVAMGMGRSGHMFACQREGVTPDFLCVAKGLTGGYLPLSATLTHDRIYEAFLGAPALGRTFFHGHTYTGNALGAAAALATLDIFKKEQILEQLPSKIEQLTQGLEGVRSLPCVGDIRQYGLAVGIELVQDKESKEPLPAADRLGMKICLAARDKGVFLRPLGDLLVLVPPLTITSEELELLIDSVKYGIQAVLGGRFS